jgi:hypothetical protein
VPQAFPNFTVDLEGQRLKPPLVVVSWGQLPEFLLKICDFGR